MISNEVIDEFSFIVACENNDFETCKDIIKNIDVNKENDNGWTLLHHAADCGNLECCKLLLENGADVNYKTHGGTTPLHLSCLNGDLVTTQIFIEYGADIDAQDKQGNSPLHRAISYNGNTSCVYFLLIQPSININIQNNKAETPFHLCCKYGSIECFQTMLYFSPGIDMVTKYGDTAFDILRREHRFILLNQLLEYKHSGKSTEDCSIQ